MQGEAEDSHNGSEIFERAFDDMCKALDKFGPGEILDLLIIHSRQDPVVCDLLTRFPTVVSVVEFLSTLPIVKVDKKTYERLKERGCIAK